MTKKCIIVQTAFLGDVLLTLPLCVAIKRMDPSQHVVLVTTPQAAEFVRGLGVVDEVIAFDKRGEHSTSSAQKALALSIASSSECTVIVPHKSFRTMLFVRSMKAQSVFTYADAATRWIATATVPYPVSMLDAARHLTLLGPIASTVPALHSLAPIRLYTPEDFSSTESMLPEGPGPLVVLAPGSAWLTKKWPAGNFRDLAGRLVGAGARVVVIGDPSTSGIVVEGRTTSDCSGKTTLRQAAAVIARANVVISNDSAPVHLASLQQVPVIALFGPTIPEFGFAPFGPMVELIGRSDLACRPCSAHGTQRCPLGTHECMTSITADSVFSSALNFLQAHDETRHASKKTTTTSQEDHFPD
ncbi:MAG: glycosyltransferase family 9 protein [Candidatus Kapabacteria bacterium]|nr:glycosyltransferase family 9 protein [Candidatus Kapabacteria bacterium]